MSKVKLKKLIAEYNKSCGINRAKEMHERVFNQIKNDKKLKLERFIEHKIALNNSTEENNLTYLNNFKTNGFSRKKFKHKY